MKNRIIIGTRKSSLALWQAEYIKGLLEKKHPSIEIVMKPVSTKGDRILDVPLAKIGGKGLFTKELETAMLNGEIDIAVHSLKDVPTELPSGLLIAAISKREDPRDAFVSNKYPSLFELPDGARVGTSSLRRRAQLLAARPDLTLTDLRGNVGTRLQKLDDGEYDAVVLAVSGLLRLGFKDRIAQILSPDIMTPAASQGALAVEARADDGDTLALIDFINDHSTSVCSKAERAFLAAAGGGCQVPVGIFAHSENDESVTIEAVIASLDGRRIYRGKRKCDEKDAKIAGVSLANELLDAGGREILRELGSL